MAKPRQVVEPKRRIPRQARAAETVAAILEATAQVLEAGGLASFTTNAVAERAGVSIGTLYQYFSDKDALMAAIAEREMKSTFARIALSGGGVSIVAISPIEPTFPCCSAAVNALARCAPNFPREIRPARSPFARCPLFQPEQLRRGRTNQKSRKRARHGHSRTDLHP